MKSVNRKVLMTLLGVVLATPFLVIALVVSIHAVALAENVRAEIFFVALALIGVAIRIADGHLAVTGRTELAERGYREPNHNTDLRGASTISIGY